MEDHDQELPPTRIRRGPDLEEPNQEAPPSSRYRAGRELGRGGLGRVYAAYDEVLRREIAIKEVLERNPEAERRLVREARITGYLQHPNIIAVHDLRRGAEGSSYTMTRVRGRSLAAVLDEAKDLDERLRLLPNFLAVVQAVAFAHNHRVLHRDLKPDNVMVGPFGETVLIDWGLAKIIGTEEGADTRPQESVVRLVKGEASNTVAGEAMGTPAYMSPEQARGDIDELGPASDVWSLGVMLYELLTGRRPFAGPSVTSTLEAVRDGNMMRIESLEPRAPPELIAIAKRALRTDPAQRYADAEALAGDVVAYESGKRVSAHEYGSGELLKRFVARHRTATAFAGLAAAALVVGFGSSYASLQSAETALERSELLRRARSMDLAEAYLERGEAAVRDRGYGEAAVLAAAAQVHLHSGTGDADRPRMTALARRARASAHVAQVRRRARRTCSFEATFATFIDEQLAVAVRRGMDRAAIWNLQTCRVERFVDIPAAAERPMRLGEAKRGWILSTKGDFTRPSAVGLWNPSKGIYRKIPFKDRVSPRLLPDGSLVAIERRSEAEDGSVVRIDSVTGLVRARSPRIPGAKALLFSPDGGFIVLLNEGRIRRVSHDLNLVGSPLPTRLVGPYHVEVSAGILSPGLEQVSLHRWEALASPGSIEPEVWARPDQGARLYPCGNLRASSILLKSMDGSEIVDATSGKTLDRLPPASTCWMSASGGRALLLLRDTWSAFAIDAPLAQPLARGARRTTFADLVAGTKPLISRSDGEGWRLDLWNAGTPRQLEASRALIPVGVALGGDAYAIHGPSGVRIETSASSEARPLWSRPPDEKTHVLESITVDDAHQVLAWSRALEGRVGLYDLSKQERLPDLFVDVEVVQLAITEGTIAVGGPDFVDIWDLERRTQSQRFPHRMADYAWLPVAARAGRVAWSDLRGQVFVWSGGQVRSLSVANLDVPSVIDIAPDGHSLCVTENGQVIVLDLQTGQELLRVTDASAACRFTSDSKRILTVSEEGEVELMPVRLDSLEASRSAQLAAAEREYPASIPLPCPPLDLDERGLPVRSRRAGFVARVKDSPCEEPAAGPPK